MLKMLMGDVCICFLKCSTVYKFFQFFILTCLILCQFFVSIDLTLDAKMNFDDNAEFRQKELFAKRDLTQQDEKEVEALKYNLNYIALDGI